MYQPLLISINQSFRTGASRRGVCSSNVVHSCFETEFTKVQYLTIKVWSYYIITFFIVTFNRLSWDVWFMTCLNSYFQSLIRSRIRFRKTENAEPAAGVEIVSGKQKTRNRRQEPNLFGETKNPERADGAEFVSGKRKTGNRRPEPNSFPGKKNWKPLP